MIVCVILLIVAIFAVRMFWYEITTPVDIPVAQQTTWYFPSGGCLIYNYNTQEVEVHRLEPYDRHIHPESWKRLTEMGENWISRFDYVPLAFRVGDEWMNETFWLNADGSVTLQSSECNW